MILQSISRMDFYDHIYAIFIPMRFTLICLFLSLAVHLSCQDLSYSQYKKQVAVQSIQALANGALIVRLTTRGKSIAKLEEFGRKEDADKLRNQVQEKNDLIVKAFREEYDFSPVYFIQSKYASDVRKGDLRNVVFIDTTGNFVEIDIQKYLVAAFATTEPDTAAFFRGYRQVVSDEGVEQKATYYSDKNMGLPALIIYSPEMIQLTDPFPYYVRTFESLPFKRSIPKTVRKMNGKLHAYYHRNKYR